MKNIFILITVFFYLTFVFSCNLETKLQEESITILLPAKDVTSKSSDSVRSHQDMFPELSRWKIHIESEDISINKYVAPETKEINLTVKKNKPLSITAQPITLNSQKKETLFFKPAGFIYPYECSASLQPLTWEGGFLAVIMEELFQNYKTTENSKKEINNFITNFNWRKAVSYINDNCSNKENYYNPWLIEKDKIQEKIITRNFSSIYLRSTSTYQVDIKLPALPHIISAYVPENKIIKETGKVLLKKENPLLFAVSKDKGVLFTLDYSKKLSQQVIFLPIYIEEL